MMVYKFGKIQTLLVVAAAACLAPLALSQPRMHAEPDGLRLTVPIAIKADGTDLWQVGPHKGETRAFEVTFATDGSKYFYKEVRAKNNDPLDTSPTSTTVVFDGKYTWNIVQDDFGDKLFLALHK
jgi:hypothetical protein